MRILIGISLVILCLGGFTACGSQLLDSSQVSIGGCNTFGACSYNFNAALYSTDSGVELNFSASNYDQDNFSYPPTIILTQTTTMAEETVIDKTNGAKWLLTVKVVNLKIASMWAVPCGDKENEQCRTGVSP